MARKSFRLAINPKSYKESGPVLSTEFLFYFVFDESAKKIVAFLWFVKNSLTFQVFCDLCCEIILSSECAGTDFFTFELPWSKFVGIRNRTHNHLDREPTLLTTKPPLPVAKPSWSCSIPAQASHVQEGLDVDAADRAAAAEIRTHRLRGRPRLLAPSGPLGSLQRARLAGPEFESRSEGAEYGD